MNGAETATDIELAVIQVSVRDVIQILENEPVQPDLIGAITAAQIMNRAAIAHLSIERALKFLIKRAGGPLLERHDLDLQLRRLVRHDPISAVFLIHSYQAAVRHYRFNPNADHMGHLRSLQSYLEEVGSNAAFQSVRYWELAQSRDALVLRRVNLTLHLELLHALHELLNRRRPKDTVVSRVEGAVHEVMWRDPELTYSPATAKEESVHSYLNWLNGFASHREALTEAARQQFMIGDDFANGMVLRAHRSLLRSPDQAVFYFADTLVVLPKQPRDVIPPVEWFGDTPARTGFVKAPSGVALGEIARRRDGLWTVSPFHNGAPVAKARNRTDAQCYLAALFVPLAELSVNDEVRRLRIVVNDETTSTWSQNRYSFRNKAVAEHERHPIKVVFWDANHGLEDGDSVTIRVSRRHGSPLIDVLKGEVTNVVQHVVHLVGKRSSDIAKEKLD